MTAQDYNVTFGYGRTDWPYSPSQPHRGNDRPTPDGTPVVIGGTTIGLTGSTGWATGPHLHTQAGWDMWCQNTTDPTPYEFQPGTVVQAGTASQWGNYVIVETPQAFVCYAHLSAIYVSIGQVLNGVTPAPVTGGGSTVDTIKSMYWRLLGREADQEGINTYAQAASDRGWEFVYNDLKNSNEGQRDWDWRNPDRVRSLETANIDLTRQLEETKAALTNAENKPPVEVIKEVERIVEKPVEVVKTVEVVKEVEVVKDEQQVVQNWLINLWNRLFKK